MSNTEHHPGGVFPASETQARTPAPQLEPTGQDLSLAEIAAHSEPKLDAGMCILRHRDSAEIVQGAILHFEFKRYHLGAWCVMPNHVHVNVQPILGYQLSDVLQSWKSYTSHRINKLLKRSGTLWERESFDHLIRTPGHLEYFNSYIEQNPVAAGLATSIENWPHSSSGARHTSSITDFLDPTELPYVEGRSRGELPHLHKDGGTYFVTWCLYDAIRI